MRVDSLRETRKWSVYKLSQEADLTPQTLYKWFETETVPTFAAIEKCCKAFGITLADFFAEGQLIEATPKLKKLYEMWCALTPDEQSSVEAIVKNYLNGRKA